MLRRILLSLCLPSLAYAQDAPSSRGFIEQFVFWLGAFAVVYLMSKMLFKEQFHERKTLRRLMHEIGPFYPEFDIDSLKRWVHQCAPHVWNIYRTDELTSLSGFMTDQFQATYRDEGPKTVGPKGEKLVFEKILKVHPLGIYMVEDVQPPAGIEIMLRLEEKVKLVEPVASTSGKQERFTQVQTFWTLKHQEGRWKLDRVWAADEDITDLADRQPVPNVKEWMPK